MNQSFEQGRRPVYQYPQVPFQTQHKDWLMTNPQPQHNPPGPRANPVPGDESTIPGY